MRKERIASLLEREIANIVAQKISDPRLGFLTITEVAVSPDLKEAVVYFTCLDKPAETLETLKRAKGHIKSILAQRISMKFIPELQFEPDDSVEYGMRIDALLDKISKDNKE